MVPFGGGHFWGRRKKVTLGENYIIKQKIVSYIENNTTIDAKAFSLLEILKKYHWNDFSRSHMDYDVSTIGGKGVPEEHKDRYDLNYLKNLFNKETLKRLPQIEFTNITTYCTEQTIKDAISNHNAIEGLEYLSSKTIFKNDVSDGVVALKSSKHIEQVAKENNIEINTRTIPGGHHNIASDKKMVKKTVDIILEPKREKNKSEGR